MLLLNIFGTISGMFLGGLLISLVIAAYRYNRILLKEFWEHIVSRGNNKLSLSKFVLLILISSIGLWLITFIILGIIYEDYYTHEECSYFALGIPIIFLIISTLLYAIFYKNREPRYPINFLITLLISCIFFITSIICVFRNQELMDWGKSKDPFIFIWISFVLFIVITALFFVSYNSSKNTKFMRGLNEALIVIMLLLGIGSLGCSWDIHFDSTAERYIMDLNHKLKSKNINVLNEGLEEVYTLLVREYGINRIQVALEGSLPDYDSRKYLFVHMYNAISKQSKEDNGLAQGIYGDYYMSYNNGNPSDHILKIAYEWWSKGAMNMDARSQCRLGDCYAGIIEIPEIDKNIVKADSLWRKAASQGYEMANTRLND